MMNLIRWDLVEGFIESFLEFVVVGGLFHQSILLGSDLCIYEPL